MATDELAPSADGDLMGDLLGDLEAGGRLDSEGAFTLDPEKARQKMRQFQLSEPHRYVLLLVQAATFAGASMIEFEIDADDMRLRFDGRPFSVRDLEELYASLFGSRGRDPSLRARQELALALNAAMALNPKFIVVQSGDGERGVRAELRPDEPDRIETVESGAVRGTSIHVKERFRPGLVMEFFRDLRGRIAEEQLLREHCLASQIPVLLDGEKISQGLRLPGEVWVDVRIDEGDLQMRCGMVAANEPARVDFVHAGVFMSSETWPALPAGFVAVVDAKGLRKDASQASLVQDEAYERVRARVRAESARVLELLALALVGQRSPATEDAPLALDARIPWLEHRMLRALEEHAAPSSRSPAGLRSALRALPIWTRIDGSKVATAELVRAPVRFVTALLDEPLPDGFETCLHLSEPEQVEALAALFPEDRQDCTSDYRQACAQAEARKRFLARRHPLALGDGAYLARHRFAQGEFEGEVGLHATGGGGVFLLLEGCFLGEVKLRSVPLPGLSVIVQGPWQPDPVYVAALPDQPLAEGLAVVADAFDAMVTQMATRAAGESELTDALRQLFLSAIHAALHDGLLGALLQGAGFDEIEKQQRMAARAGRPHPLRCEGWQHHGMAHLRLFETVDRRWLSLVELHTQCGEGPVRVIAPKNNRLREPPFVIVRPRTSKLELEILEAVLGRGRVARFDDEYGRLLAREDWLGRPQDSLWISAPLKWGPMSGDERSMLGIEPGDELPDKGRSKAWISLYVAGRSVGSIWIKHRIPGLVAALDVDDFALIVEDYRKKEGQAVLRRHLDRALAAWIDSVLHEPHDHEELPVPHRHALLWVLAAVLPGDGMWALQDHLAQVHPAEDMLRRLRVVIHLAEFSPRAFDLMEEALQGDKPELEQHHADKAEHEETLASLLAPRIEAIGQLPLVLTSQGVLSLEQLQSCETVAWLQGEQHALIADAPERPWVLVEDLIEVEVLRRLLGKDVLVWGVPVIEQWRREREFEQREPLQSLELGAQALVALDVDHDGIRGQIGLRARHPDLVTQSVIEVCNRKRRICAVSSNLDWKPVGILDGDFGAEQGFESISEQETGRVEAIVRRYEHRVFAALADGFDPEHAVSRAWVSTLLLARLQRGSLARAPEEVRPFLDLPLLLDHTGTALSLSELERSTDRREGPWVFEQSAASIEIDEGVRPIQIREPKEHDLLVRVFGGTRSWAAEVARREAVQRRKQQAPPRPEPPKEPLGIISIDARGLHGNLWLPAPYDPDVELALCRGDKEVTRVRLYDYLPFAGAVWGSGVRVDDDFTQAELRQRQRTYLLGRAAAMTSALIHRYRAALEGTDPPPPEPGEPPLCTDFERMRTALRTIATRLQAERRRAKLASGHVRRLLRDLVDLPLIRLPNDRLVSLKTVRLEKPTEFAHLWMLDDEDDDTEPRRKSKSEDRAPSRAEPPPKPKPKTKSPKLPARPERAAEPMPVLNAEAPAPEPAPEPSPEELLLEAIRAELRLIRKNNAALLSEAHLDGLHLQRRSGRILAEHIGARTFIDRAHPMVERAIAEHGRDPMWVSVIASCVYTALNHALEGVTDHDEAAFVRHHVEHLLTGRPRAG